MIIVMNSPVFSARPSQREGHKVCEEMMTIEGKQEATEELQKRCDDMILLTDNNEDRRLVEMCTSNVKVSKSKKSGVIKR